MKKLSKILFIAVLCLGLAACGSNDSNSDIENESQISDTEVKEDEKLTQSTVIELTAENWSDYFAIVPAAKEAKDGNGNLIGLTTWYDLVFKEGISEKVVETEIKRIDYFMSEVFFCWYSFNMDTQSLMISDALSDSELDQYEISSSDLQDTRDSAAMWADKYAIDYGFFLEYTNGYLATHYTEGNTIYQLVPAFAKITVDEIKGTITLSE